LLKKLIQGITAKKHTLGAVFGILVLVYEAYNFKVDVSMVNY
jgi:hypothetical protein